MSMNRRKFVKSAMLLPTIPIASSTLFDFSEKTVLRSNQFRRVRPGDTKWPSKSSWNALSRKIGGRLIKLESPFTVCKTTANDASCNDIFQKMKNPYFIGDNPALTQTSGWLDAWASTPSAYAVAAKNTSDIVAAVNFARENNLRLVVKGGGHSYQGTSNAADSLLIWTRAMNTIVMHDNFLAEGHTEKQIPQFAVTIEAGAMWLQAYDAVTTKAGRYVQGGGCTTVGVAGLIQGGGFGSFSKYYGLAAAALLQAEIVTADGSVKIANAHKNPDLFWALKGGGGGSFGVVTKLTLKTRELPENFGAVFGTIKASSDEAFKKLIARMIHLYQDQLFNPHWGEQITFSTGNTVTINMLFHGLSKEKAEACWKSFEQWVKEAPQNYTFEMPLNIITIPARYLWDTAFLKQNASHFIATDDRPNAPEGNVYWLANKDETGQFLYSYHSAWLPDTLLENDNQFKLADALFSASRYWSTSLHFNKGLAGAPAEEITAARDTAINPAVLSAFALAIIAGEGEPAFTGIPGHEPDLTEARRGAEGINKAMEELKKAAPNTGSYLSESYFFEQYWQQSFWGSNYSRLVAVKKEYDPEGLFFVRHGVGSEEWSNDGFTKLNDPKY